jgi:serine/threonine protein kinase
MESTKATVQVIISEARFLKGLEAKIKDGIDRFAPKYIDHGLCGEGDQQYNFLIMEYLPLSLPEYYDQ